MDASLTAAGGENPSAYIPLDRRRALSHSEDLPDRLWGAALFSDISGFTPLTEALVNALGPRRGAEELTGYLNRVYDALVAEVDRHGGSVTGFAGDAITCWFDRDGGRVATACGLAMQRAMAQFAEVVTPGGDTAMLAIKVAIATGPARRFVVGDPDLQLIDVLAGATLERMVAAEHVAKRGEVVVEGEVAARLDGLLVVQERREDGDGGRFAVVKALAATVDDDDDTVGSALDPLSLSLLDEQTRPWLLPPVYERLKSGQGDFLAELRPAVTLFLGFSGLDYDGDPDAGHKLDGYVRWVQHTLARYGGSLLQIIIGDKGSYLYAAFGAPLANDDDAERAVAAALELCPASGQPGAYGGEIDPCIGDIQVGISAGRVRVGAYGGVTRRTYGLLGDEVNVAARLMGRAQPGQILVAEDVYRRARSSFVWEALDAISVKGKARPISIYQPTAALRHQASGWQEPRYDLPMVGRAEELETAQRTLSRALAGQGQIVAISAEAGMGKSRLIAEIIRDADTRRVDAYVGECQSYGINDSYLPWQAIWRSIFALDDVEDVDAQLRMLEAHLAAIDPALVPRLPLLGVALNIPIPDNELTASLDAKLRKESLEALLVDCLAARARQAPLLLVLEDCHWLDPLSHDLLEAIGRAMVDLPVLLVVAYRPPEADRLQAPRVTGLPHCTVIALTDFTREEAERLIALKLAQFSGAEETPPPGLVARIMERSQGNPFYIEELLNYLHDLGLDPRDAPAVARLELPASLSSLILSRIDRLGEHEKSTIRVASIVGRLFRVRWLWGAHPGLGSEAQVESDLERMSRLDLTPLDQPEPERVYLFKHLITREVAYESLPYASRALMHGQLGGFIEDTYADALDQYVDLLAYHYDLSEIVPKKREYLQRAGDAARDAYANEVAIDYYRRLLPLLPDEEKAVAVLALGQVLELTGAWDEANDLYRQALRLSDGMDDLRGQATAQRAVGWLLRKRGEYHEAASWLAQAHRGFEALGDLAALSGAMTELGEVSRQLGAYAQAKKWYDDALSLAASAEERKPRLTAQAQALKGAGTLAAKQGENAVARSLYEESLALLRELGDGPRIAALLNNMGVVAYYMGDYEAARMLDEESLAAFRKIGDRWAAGQLLNNLGDIARDQGDYVAARRLHAESLGVRRQLGDQGGLALSLNSMGDLLLDEGDYLKAHPVLVESLKINVEMGDRAAIAYLLDDFAALAATEGQPERALRLAGAAAGAHGMIGAQVSASERARFDRLQAPAWQSLGASLAAAAWDEGRALTLEQAVTYALEERIDS